MISKENVKKIAIDYLIQHLNDYKIVIHEEPFGNIYYAYDYPIEDVYFVECVRKDPGYNTERFCILISKKDGKMIGFESNIHDERIMVL